MRLSVKDIATRLQGVVEGDDTMDIRGLAGLREAEPDELSFLAHARYQPWLAQTRASAVLVAKDWSGACPCTVIRVDNPTTAFVEAAGWWAAPVPPVEPGVHPTAVLGRDVRLGENASVGPHCVLGDGVCIGADTVIEANCVLGDGTVVGDHCRLYPLVSVREGTRIGHRTLIHNGAVIGSDGFGYDRAGPGWKKIPQLGIVVIGDDVEIGANSTIDRARFGKTVIGNGVKIDNLVQVAHNCQLGDHCAVAALVGFAGSTILGDGVQVGGQAGFAGHLRVGAGTVVAGRAGVIKDMEGEQCVSDFPAMPHAKARRMHAHVMRLPELKKKVDDLERRIQAIKEPGVSS